MPNLATGYDIIIQNKVSGVNTPIYPITKIANVRQADGTKLDAILATLATISYVDGKHYVPENEAEASSIRFLRNDNTWATIRSATAGAAGAAGDAGIVALSTSTNLDSDDVAATASAVKAVKDAVDTLTTTASDTYVEKTQLGATTTVDAQTGDVTLQGVATLDTNGKVPAAQLPSYVDDVIDVDVTLPANASDPITDVKLTGTQTAVEGEAGKVYIDVTTKKTYRYGGSSVGFVNIASDLALGETSSTAFRGDYGKIAYDHANAAHARTDAMKVAASDANGYIHVYGGSADSPDETGSEILVYTHPSVDGASSTNPHGTTKADVGLGNVENKDSATIRSEITSANVTTALGYTPQDASVVATGGQSGNSGVMSAAQATKLDNTSQIAVSADEPTWSDGIWFQIETQAVDPDPGE